MKKVSVPVSGSEKQQEIANHITDIRKQTQRLKDKTSELLEQASQEIEKLLIG